MSTRNNATRGTLLKFLRDVFPEGPEAMNVVAIFYQIIPPREIIDSLEYLVSKGYVDKRVIPNPARKLETITTYRINAQGIDVAEGLTSDVGISIVAGV